MLTHILDGVQLAYHLRKMLPASGKPANTRPSIFEAESVHRVEGAHREEGLPDPDFSDSGIEDEAETNLI